MKKYHPHKEKGDRTRDFTKGVGDKWGIGCLYPESGNGPHDPKIR